MGKPRLIIIIRHAQSEGNRDKTIHQTVPDHRVGLTPEGYEQACEAGEKLRQLLRNDDTIHFFISPYRRTRETTEGILSTLCANEPVPSPFQRSHIKVYEEPRLREQDFGNFQPGTEETERLWRERASYGHFFYRIPNGESGADVYDRVSSFNGSLWRRFSEDSMASVAILVTHGLCSRVFLMAWYHYSVEFFEDLRNINHCEFLVMKLAKNGRYVLQNQLRRWSDLRRERAQRRSISGPGQLSDIPVRRWGSSRSQQELAGKMSEDDPPKPVRQNTTDLFKEDDEDDSTDARSPERYRQERRSSQNREHKFDDQDKSRSQQSTPPSRNISNLSSKLREVTLRETSEDEDGNDDGNVSLKHTSDDGSEELEALQHGRDGGGSKSGFASPTYLSGDEDESIALSQSYDAERKSLSSSMSQARKTSTHKQSISQDANKDTLESTTPKSKAERPRDVQHASNRSTSTITSSNSNKELNKSSSRSMASALRGDFDEPAQRVMADALGDQSDAEVEEFDLEMGTKEKQRKEMAYILREERRDRMKEQNNDY